MAKSIQQQYIAWIKENLDVKPSERMRAFRQVSGYEGPRLKIKSYDANGVPTSVAVYKPETSGVSQRLNDLKKQDQAYIDTWLEKGYSQEQAETALKGHKKNHKGLTIQVRDSNRQFGENSFSLGHGTAVKEGGGDFAGNERLEIGKSKDGRRGNYSRSNLDELPDNVKPLLGQPRSGAGGRDSALMDILELENPGIMDKGLTPQDNQRIRANPELADDIMTERQQAIEVNPEAKAPNKVARVQAGVTAKNGGIHFKPNQALRVARMAAPIAASVPLSFAASAMSASAAVKEPTVNNIEDAVWDGANLAADLVGLIPTPLTVGASEIAQKGLGIAHQARLGQRAINQAEDKPGIDPINGALHFIKKLVTKPANMEFTSM